jgi:hypothetical protein
VMSGVVPPTLDELRRVRRCTSGTRLWTCYAGRAGTRIRSAAPHRRLTRARAAADREGATIDSAPPNQIVKPRGPFAETLSIRPRSGSNPRLPVPLTVILDSTDLLSARAQESIHTFLAG